MKMNINPASDATRWLSQLFTGLLKISPDQDCLVQGLAIDSRQVKKDYVFFAYQGSTVHGCEYMDMAIRQGASVVVVDSFADTQTLMSQSAVAVFVVPNLQQQIGVIAARFFGAPSSALQVTGVTGTNGKTSCTHFIAQCLSDNNQATGLIGSLGVGLWGDLVASSHTTPDAIAIQQAFAVFRAKQVKHVVMEVSSHGLAQGRVMGSEIDTAIFTNLSHDHLDYHGSIESYAKVKSLLFRMASVKRAIINVDDAEGQKLMQCIAPSVKRVGYGLSPAVMGFSGLKIRADIVRQDLRGLRLAVEGDWGAFIMEVPLIGRFNASNVLAVSACLLVLGLSVERVIQCVSQLRAPSGRMERFGGCQDKPLVIVDYAHTPDALRQVLQTLREHCEHVLWVVFGCGGDRDRAKRAVMGKAAAQLADRVVLTDDNPRTENPDQIIKDIQQGVLGAGSLRPEQVDIKRDRVEAIHYAIEQASPNDIVLIAGKGHEDYQQIGSSYIPFSDRQVIAEMFGEAA